MLPSLFHIHDTFCSSYSSCYISSILLLSSGELSHLSLYLTWSYSLDVLYSFTQFYSFKMLHFYRYQTKGCLCVPFFIFFFLSIFHLAIKCDLLKIVHFHRSSFKSNHWEGDKSKLMKFNKRIIQHLNDFQYLSVFLIIYWMRIIYTKKREPVVYGILSFWRKK